MQQVLWHDNKTEVGGLLSFVQPLSRRSHLGRFTNDVSREGEDGGHPNSDTVREVA